MEPGQLDAIKADPAALTKLDYYHVFLGLLGPDDVHGQRPTQEGAEVKVTGKGGDIKVNDTAKVVCGGIQAEQRADLHHRHGAGSGAGRRSRSPRRAPARRRRRDHDDDDHFGGDTAAPPRLPAAGRPRRNGHLGATVRADPPKRRSRCAKALGRGR